MCPPWLWGDIDLTRFSISSGPRVALLFPGKKTTYFFHFFFTEYGGKILSVLAHKALVHFIDFPQFKKK